LVDADRRAGIDRAEREKNLVNRCPEYAAQIQRVQRLTPGIYNSAYFEHAFLVQQMGVPLVEGQRKLSSRT